MLSKYKKIPIYSHSIIIISCLIIVLIIAVMGVYNNNQNQENIADEMISLYKVIYNDSVIGIVSDQEKTKGIFADAMDLVQQEVGKPLLFDKKIQFYIETSKQLTKTDEQTLLNNFTDVMRANLDTTKTKAYVLQIGTNLKVILEDESAIEEVLKNTLCQHVEDINNYKISLIQQPFSESIKVPKIIQFKNVSEDIVLNTSASTNKMNEENNEMIESTNSFTTDVFFTESIQITETYIEPSQVTAIDIATDIITKRHMKEEIYTVRKGDVPSLIAQDHDISLSELYLLNPGLQDKKYIQIGEELIVNVPQAELSVTTKEQIIYKEPIQPPIEYVNNTDKYEGYSKVIDEGYEGIKEVTAIITKVDDKELSREILSETIIKEPKAKVIEKGSNPLPKKGATGTFITPVEGARLSSPFGLRHGSLHHGIDLACPYGTDIKASDGGRVVFVGYKRIYGKTVEIDHGDGILTRYAHCSKIIVKEGTQVSQNQKIAEVGLTGYTNGPHVHFEIRLDGVAVNPYKYLK